MPRAKEESNLPHVGELEPGTPVEVILPRGVESGAKGGAAASPDDEEEEEEDTPPPPKAKKKAAAPTAPAPDEPDEEPEKDPGAEHVAGHLVGMLVAIRRTRYRPLASPDFRQDLNCLSCNVPYRPANSERVEDYMFCVSCVRDWETNPEGRHEP